jgi:tetratricopeptide (TPR) repeat protein
MRTVLATGAFALLASGGQAAAEAPEKLERPFLVYVCPADALALEPAGAPKDVMDSVEDVRKNIEKKRRGWMKLVPSLEQAEVLVAVVGREVTESHGSVLRGRYTLFTDQGDLIGQGDLSGQQIFGIWGTAAADMSGRLQRLLEAFYPVISEERETLPRPATVLAVRHGEVLARRGDPEVARARFEKALALSPDHFPALRGRGQALVDLGAYEAALVDFDRVIEAEHADAATFFARARARDALGYDQEADEDRRVALTAVPRNAEPGPLAVAPGGEPDPAAAISAELTRRDAEIVELQRRADDWRRTMKSTSDTYEKAVHQARYDLAALDAALRSCQAGDQAVCGALVTRAVTGVAEIPVADAPPPPGPETVDRALVSVAAANLRSGPSTGDGVVRRLVEGDLLVLLDREAQQGWYPVIHVASADQGWIHGDLLGLELAEKPPGEGPSPFRGRRLTEDAPPKVIVTNDGDLTMTLTVGAEHHTIPPGNQRTLEVAAGNHRYVGAAPGALPALGRQLFERGHEYTWRFWIERKPAP